MVCGFSIYGGKDTKKTKKHISKLAKKYNYLQIHDISPLFSMYLTRITRYFPCHLIYFYALAQPYLSIL